MQLDTFGLCEQGARAHQDDAFAAREIPAGTCIVVADGAGGHAGGRVAAQVVVEVVVHVLAAATRVDDGALIAAVDAASLAVQARRRQEPGLREMTATVALLCIDPRARSACWTHLGDSRIYLVRDGAMERLTTDHSVVQRFIDAGLGSRLRPAIDRNLLYAAVGTEGEMRPAVGRREGLRDGDAFLVCSDGVWDAVDEPAIARLRAAAPGARSWVEAIVAAVRAAGHPQQDNYTAVGCIVSDAG